MVLEGRGQRITLGFYSTNLIAIEGIAALRYVLDHNLAAGGIGDRHGESKESDYDGGIKVHC